MIDNLMQSVFRFPQLILMMSLVLAVLGGGVIILATLHLLSQHSSSSIEVLSAPVSTVSPDNTDTIFVDINGAVVTPGMFELPADARVTDVVQMAGGFTDQADADYIAKQLNLSQKLNDSQKIYIPFLGTDSDNREASSSQSSSTVQAQNGVNINTASISELQNLDGVGEARAKQIISNRPYQSIEELVEKKALPQSVFDKNKESLTI